MTFLGQGRLDTPEGITVAEYAEFESGRWLEMHLFGGTTEYYRDATQDNQQV